MGVPLNDVVEPMPPAGAVPVLVMIPPEGFADTPDPVRPGDVVMLVEPGNVVIGALNDPGEDVLLLDVERGDVGPVSVDGVEIPLPPSTDPDEMLATGLQGSAVVLGSPEV